MSAESLRVPRWANPSRATIAGGGFMTDITLPDPNAKDLLIGIAGAGLMGRGIAQVAVQGGCRVKLYDANTEAATTAVDFLRQMFMSAAEKGQIPAEVVEAIVARVQIVGAVADLADCAIVIEAIAENLDAKHALFAELDQVCAPDAILASNTSMLSITTIASVCQRPERVAGMHFFNPVPVMKLVEVIDGLRGHDAVGNVLMDLARRFGPCGSRIRLASSSTRSGAAMVWKPPISPPRAQRPSRRWTESCAKLAAFAWGPSS
jgi:NAD(P)-dependent dehydrogenase (short-subunit alcohol dehydrogenase family)